MKQILRSRLPERFAAKLPPIVSEIAIALLITASMTAARIALKPFTADRAPFAFVFVAVIGSTVLAGWRSGLLALVLGQLAAWYLVLDSAGYAAARLNYVSAFAVATFAQLMALIIVALYQREVDRAWSQREEQVELIRHALAEIDHRTFNNYQTALALVSAQARQADAPVREALEQVSDRIRAIAMASKQLAVSSGSLEEVRVDRHLAQLCGELGKGLTRPGIEIRYNFEDISLGADETIWISILVNELVTNALKHAFPDDREGLIRVALHRTDAGLALVIEDDGAGIGSGRASGLGTRLVQTFTKQLGANHQTESDGDGTRHRIQIPHKK